MRTITALLIESSDRTKDGNVKSHVFDAVLKADIVIENGQIIKGSILDGAELAAKRATRASEAAATSDEPQCPTGEDQSPTEGNDDD